MGLGQTVSDTVFLEFGVHRFSGSNKLLYSEQDWHILHRALGQIMELGNMHMWKKNQSIIEEVSI